MYYRAVRTLWGLAAIGAAVAVGVTTHDAAFTAITFIGSLLVPRVLGLYPSRWRRMAMARHGMGWKEGCGPWSRHGEHHTEQTPTTAQTV